MNLQGIFDGLLTFFEVAPNGTETQFINGLKANELATQEEAELFIFHFLAIGVDIGLLNSADFDVLMARRRDVGLGPATRGARIIFEEMKALAAFRVVLLQERLVVVQAVRADYEAKLPKVATARQWIVNNSPAAQDVTDACLEAVDFGTDQMQRIITGMAREEAVITEQIEALS
jgi:hypothetical protein